MFVFMKVCVCVPSTLFFIAYTKHIHATPLTTFTHAHTTHITRTYHTQMSGINPSVAAFADYKKIKMGGEHTFGLFQIANDASIECIHLGAPSKSMPTDDWKTYWDNDIVKVIQDTYSTQACFIVTEFRYKDGERDVSKITLISWCPESKLKVKVKMLHGSSLNGIKSSFEISKHVQCATIGELDFDAVKAAIMQI